MISADLPAPNHRVPGTPSNTSASRARRSGKPQDSPNIYPHPHQNSWLKSPRLLLASPHINHHLGLEPRNLMGMHKKSRRSERIVASCSLVGNRFLQSRSTPPFKLCRAGLQGRRPVDFHLHQAEGAGGSKRILSHAVWWVCGCSYGFYCSFACSLARRSRDILYYISGPAAH